MQRSVWICNAMSAKKGVMSRLSFKMLRKKYNGLINEFAQIGQGVALKYIANIGE
jgi:hypothetical protein